MKSKIENFAKENMPQILDDIRELVAVRSIKGKAMPGMPYGEDIAKVVACMEKLAHKHGFSTTNFDNYMLTARLNDKPDELGILCHLDVVHEGTGWSSPPFEMDIRDGCIYGRGTADNKGPAVAALYAMKCVRELGIPLKKNVRLMLGTDEESGMSDLTEYFKREAPPPFCFSPDAAFPVYNIEKGRYGPSFSANFQEHKSTPRIAGIKGGHAANIVPDEAEALLDGVQMEELSPYLDEYAKKTGVKFHVEEKNGGLLVKASGLSSHAAYPEDGNNAVTALIALVSNLPFFSGEGYERLSTLSALIPHGDWAGEKIGIQMEDELSGILTCNLGVFEYTPTSITGRIDIRSPICSNKENCADVMENCFTSAGFDISSSGMVLPHHVSEDLPFIKTLMRAFEEYSGLPGECVSMGGGTYVHGIPNAVAFGAAFPDTETNAHAADEYAVIDELEACVKIFSQIIIDICG